MLNFKYGIQLVNKDLEGLQNLIIKEQTQLF
jgi:hypothetical protein